MKKVNIKHWLNFFNLNKTIDGKNIFMIVSNANEKNCSLIQRKVLFINK